MAFADPNDQNAEKSSLEQRNLRSCFEVEQPLVFHRPAVDAVVLLAAGDEEELVEAGHVETRGLGLVPLHGWVANPREGVLLD